MDKIHIIYIRIEYKNESKTLGTYILVRYNVDYAD